jgi:tetratricopeptide (TPR) repeat protein
MPEDPYRPHLNRAAELFKAGDVVQAGQIWQAVLKREPANPEARAGLYQVKLFLERRNAGQDNAEANEKLLREGCTLYDMGEVQGALQKWELILATDPGHRLAQAYANDARKELGLPALAAPGAALASGADRPGPPPEPARKAAPPPPEAGTGSADQEAPDPAEQVDRLVREGSQLFDMGMTEEAVAKWDRALVIQPDNQDAAAYLQVARWEAQRRPAAAAPAAQGPSGPAPAAQDPLESRILRAEQLIRSQRLEEAAQAFQRLLAMAPQDPRILQGYHQARALLNARNEPPLPARSAQPAPVVTLARPPQPPERRQPALPAPVGPPQSVTAGRGAQRDGFRLPAVLQGSAAKLPARLRKFALPERLRRPRILASGLGALALLALGIFLWEVHSKEVALREAVAVAKHDALRPVSRMVVVPQLEETADAIHHEADRALEDDPLLAYYRGKEWLRLDPDNASAAQFVARAKGKLAGAPATPWSAADFDKEIHSGDLETARKCILALLAQAPDDPELKERARTVELALIPLYAAKERLDDARQALLLCRAMFPTDRSWQARLKLLEALETMAASERIPWLQLLG